jgi:phosphate transport system permease protein
VADVSRGDRAMIQSAGRTLVWRNSVNALLVGLTLVAALIATLPLLFILWHLLRQGARVLNVEFFTTVPQPIGETGGGVANAIVGSFVVVGIAAMVGLPVGIGAGLFLAEQRTSRLANAIRFLSDVLNGLPSIVMGIFAWGLLVRPFGHFSALAGGISLGAMMIPLVTRTTEEMIRVVPISLREAALALGYSRWRTSLAIVLRTALPGIVTGALVAVARIAGESAPLLFTVLGNLYFSTSITQPIAALPLQIYTYASSPAETQIAQAWGGALVLIALVFVVSLIARYVTRAKFAGGSGD